jgi:hypothetical protein
MRRRVHAARRSRGEWLVAARPQQPATPVIGFLSSRSPGESTDVVAAFHEGLRETGFVEAHHLNSAGVHAVCEAPKSRITFDRECFAADPRIAKMRWDRGGIRSIQ